MGSGGASGAALYNGYGTYYGYSKDTVRLTYTTDAVETSLQRFSAGLIDFVGADTALDPDQLGSVLADSVLQLPTAGLPLVLAYNIPSLLPTDSLVSMSSLMSPVILPRARVLTSFPPRTRVQDLIR